MVTPQMSLVNSTVESGIPVLSRSGHHFVPTRMPVLKEAKYTQVMNSGCFPNDNMASDFSTPQFHAINDVCLHYVWFANTIVAKYVLHL